MNPPRTVARSSFVGLSRVPRAPLRRPYTQSPGLATLIVRLRRPVFWSTVHHMRGLIFVFFGAFGVVLGACADGDPEPVGVCADVYACVTEAGCATDLSLAAEYSACTDTWGPDSPQCFDLYDLSSASIAAQSDCVGVCTGPYLDTPDWPSASRTWQVATICNQHRLYPEYIDPEVLVLLQPRCDDPMTYLLDEGYCG